MVAESKRRDQLNISLGSDSPLARKLHEAEQITGQSRSLIARSVLDTFLETWLTAEETRKRIIDAAKAASQAEAIAAVVVRELGTLRPPRRDDADRPAPDYWQAAESRRPMPPHIVSRHVNAPVRRTVQPRPRTGSFEPVPVPDEAGEGDLSD